MTVLFLDNEVLFFMLTKAKAQKMEIRKSENMVTGSFTTIPKKVMEGCKRFSGIVIL
jgi:hypothetical protein